MNVKKVIAFSFYSFFLFACSGNSEVDYSGFTSTNNTYPTRGFLIEQPKQITIHIPQSKSVLNKLQLFSGTLDAHNSVREKHNLPPLSWSKELEKDSQEWSDHLGSGKSCKMYHRPEKADKENLFIVGPKVWYAEGEEIYRDRTKVTIRDVVKEWTEGEKWYNSETKDCQEGKQCEQYKQLISRNTTEVGCAVTFCADDSQTWVCSYNPDKDIVSISKL